MFRYDRMVEEALRGVVRQAVGLAAEHGLPGDHHFYVTFNTGHAGVRIPGHLKARHPDEMTIVLQHQFWGLELVGDSFEVTLSFGGVSERLHIPFAAVTGFADPSAKFGLQFQAADAAEEGAPESEPEPASPDSADGQGGEGKGKVVALDAFRKK
jgi:hypothetical protein